MDSKARIRVVAAEIELEGRFLITQRRADSSFPLLWEFPSGKVEPGEDDGTALAREIMERLGAQATVGGQVMVVEREYERYVIDFCVYRCTVEVAELRPLRVLGFRWVTVPELADYEFPPADQESIDTLLRGD